MKSKKLKLVFPSKMKSAYWFFSLIYAMFEVIQGLFFHPYQTVQFLVKKKLFKILIFFPVFCLLFIYLLGLILGEFGQYLKKGGAYSMRTGEVLFVNKK